MRRKQNILYFYEILKHRIKQLCTQSLKETMYSRKQKIESPMEKVHRAEDYFRKVIYDKLHFYYICKT